LAPSNLPGYAVICLATSTEHGSTYQALVIRKGERWLRVLVWRRPAWHQTVPGTLTWPKSESSPNLNADILRFSSPFSMVFVFPRSCCCYGFLSLHRTELTTFGPSKGAQTKSMSYERALYCIGFSKWRLQNRSTIVRGKGIDS
jgi:hypothetical protein